jgi:hypothetical protein
VTTYPAENVHLPKNSKRYFKFHDIRKGLSAQEIHVILARAAYSRVSVAVAIAQHVDRRCEPGPKSSCGLMAFTYPLYPLAFQTYRESANTARTQEAQEALVSKRSVTISSPKSLPVSLKLVEWLPACYHAASDIVHIIGNPLMNSPLGAIALLAGTRARRG